MSQQPIVQQAGTSTPDNFWQSFRLFAFRFEQYGFTHWYVFAIGYLLVALSIDLLTDMRTMYLVHTLHQSFPGYQDFDTTKTDWLANWLLITSGVSLILSVLFFNRWWRSIPSIFRGVLNRGLLRSSSPGSNIHQDYQHFLTEYQERLLSPRRYLFIAALVIIIVVSVLIQSLPAVSERISGADPWLLFLGWLLVILRVILLTLLASYFIAVATWTTSVTGWYIKRLTTKFDLVIQPRHPDRCGGLKSLGTFCLDMALPILVGAVVLAVYSFGSIFYPFLINDQPVVRLLADAGLVAITLPLATIIFFVPLWDIHRRMLESKEAYDEEFTAYLAEIEARVAKLQMRIRAFLDTGTLEEAKKAREEMDIVQALQPNQIEYPTWPFNLRTLLTFLAPQLVTIIGLVLPLIIHP